jgi:hypothetical protein
VTRPDDDAPIEQRGDAVTTSHPMPVILSSWQDAVSSDNNGSATCEPSVGAQPSEVESTASIGVSSLSFELESVAATGTGNGAVGLRRPVQLRTGTRPRTEE